MVDVTCSEAGTHRRSPGGWNSVDLVSSSDSLNNAKLKPGRTFSIKNLLRVWNEMAEEKVVILILQLLWLVWQQISRLLMDKHFVEPPFTPAGLLVFVSTRFAHLDTVTFFFVNHLNFSHIVGDHLWRFSVGFRSGLWSILTREYVLS